MVVPDHSESSALSGSGPSFLGGQTGLPFFLPPSWESCSTGRSHGAAVVVLFHSLSIRPPTDLVVVNSRLLGAHRHCQPCRLVGVRSETSWLVVITRRLLGADRFVRSQRGDQYCVCYLHYTPPTCGLKDRGSSGSDLANSLIPSQTGIASHSRAPLSPSS